MESSFIGVDIIADILVQPIEIHLHRSLGRGELGVNGPKFGQEYVKGLPAERKAQRWTMLPITNSLGKNCQIGERSVVLKALPYLLDLIVTWRAALVKLS